MTKTRLAEIRAILKHLDDRIIGSALDDLPDILDAIDDLLADAEKHAGRVLPVAERIAARLPGARARTGPGQVEIGHVALFCNSGRIWHDGTVYAELEEHKAELRRLYEEERDGVG